MDWRIKDNLIIALNFINKRLAIKSIEDKRRDVSTRFYSLREIKPFFMKKIETKKLTPLETSIYIKTEFKKGNYMNFIDDEEITP